MKLFPKSFLRDIFGCHHPGRGSVKVEKSRQDRTEDVKLAKYLKRKFGGNYVVLSDITPQGVKVPDLLLTDRALFENKRITSLKSLDSQTRKALAQLDKINLAKLRAKLDSDNLRHVLVIQTDNDFDYDDLEKVILHRINRYKTKNIPYIDYVIVRKKGRIDFVWKYKEAP